MTALRLPLVPFVASAGLLLLLAGCGQGAASEPRAAPAADGPQDPVTEPTGPDLARTGPALVRDGEPLVLCGLGEPFPASVLRDGVPGLVDPADVLAALDELRGKEGGETSQLLVQAPSAADVPRRVVGVEEHAARRDVVVLLGALPADGQRPELDVVHLDEQDGRWRARGWGGCEVTPALPAGADWAEIAVPPGGLDRAATALTLAVEERSCTSGRDPAPFLGEPVVVEDEGSVTVSWTTDTAQGAQTCVGNGSVLREVPLAAPLGDRALLDGRTWPPLQVTGADR